MFHGMFWSNINDCILIELPCCRSVAFYHSTARLTLRETVRRAKPPLVDFLTSSMLLHFMPIHIFEKEKNVVRIKKLKTNTLCFCVKSVVLLSIKRANSAFCYLHGLCPRIIAVISGLAAMSSYTNYYRCAICTGDCWVWHFDSKGVKNLSLFPCLWADRTLQITMHWMANIAVEGYWRV